MTEKNMIKNRNINENGLMRFAHLNFHIFFFKFGHLISNEGRSSKKFGKQINKFLNTDIEFSNVNECQRIDRILIETKY
ncbi:hypothetical protein BpHYR1_052471 [Brachionus plicatilis]|uniref:Uncharacterized protein n=1 Tax=Brachionus plicatilis TaxID=10195 RepID=A0A3M7QPT1_BRAPC|nr:hypothetical protein BpHYR1_052471 [Brachionus plicatilis]